MRLHGPSTLIHAEPIAGVARRELPAPVTEPPPREPVAVAAPARP